MAGSAVVQETARQVLALSNKARRAVGLGHTLLAIDDTTLRVSLARVERGRTFRNVDIKYNRGSDLYDVTIHLLDRHKLGQDDCCKSRTVEGVFNDQLGEVVDGVGSWGDA